MCQVIRVKKMQSGGVSRWRVCYQHDDEERGNGVITCGRGLEEDEKSRIREQLL